MPPYPPPPKAAETLAPGAPKQTDPVVAEPNFRALPREVVAAWAEQTPSNPTTERPLLSSASTRQFVPAGAPAHETAYANHGPLRGHGAKTPRHRAIPGRSFAAPISPFLA